MTRMLLAIDPGWETGISLWTVPDEEPIERRDFWGIIGGTRALEDWWYDVGPGDSYWGEGLFIVCEQYIDDGRAIKPDPNATRIEGYLEGVWGMDDVIWQRNAMKNTKVGDKLLKQHGYLVSTKDGIKSTAVRDVNDSQLHALAWAKNNHRPSQEYFWPKGK